MSTAIAPQGFEEHKGLPEKKADFDLKDGKYDDVKAVYDGLTDKEKNFVTPGRRIYKDVPKYLAGRTVAYNGETPVGFSDIYGYNNDGSLRTSPNICLAVSGDARGKHLASTMTKDVMHKVLERAKELREEKGARADKIKRFVWMILKGNDSSARAAINSGFKEVPYRDGSQRKFIMSRRDAEKKAEDKDIVFPKDEIKGLAGRGSIVTHRVSDDAGKYEAGDIVKSPWGDRYEVADRKDISNVDDSPYYKYLTDSQKALLKVYDRIAVLRLKKTEKKASDEDIEAKARMHYPDEGSHGWNHIQDVIASARRMRRRELIKKELAAIMYHDSSLMTGNRETHAEDSAEIARKELAGFFRKKQLDDIVNAIAHHRASYEGKRSSRLEDLVAAADRPVPNLAKQIARSWKYHEELGEPEELRAANVASHLKDKYGHGGYAYSNAPKLYIKTYGKELKDIMSKFDGLTPESVKSMMSGQSEKKADDKSDRLARARAFVLAVKKEALKRKLNFFLVTDGASGIMNNGNPAVRNAREAQIKWELEHGYDPYEDWGHNEKRAVSFSQDGSTFQLSAGETPGHAVKAWNSANPSRKITTQQLLSANNGVKPTGYGIGKSYNTGITASQVLATPVPTASASVPATTNSQPQEQPQPNPQPQQQRPAGTPIGYWNNNPGNLLSDGKTLWEGATGVPAKGKDLAFKDYGSGYRAMARVLYNYKAKYGIDTLESVMNRYPKTATPEIKEKYMNFIRSKTGWQPNEKIDLTNTSTLQQIVPAMASFEIGPKYTANYDPSVISNAVLRAIPPK